MKRMEWMAARQPLSRMAAFLREQSVLLWNGAYFLLGGCLSSASLFAAVAPFGAAFCAAVPKNYLSAAVFGTVLGYALSGASIGNLKYIAALLVIYLVRRLFDGPSRPFGRSMYACILGAASVWVPSGILAAYTGGTAYLFAVTLADGALAGSTAFFFARTIDTLSARRSVGLLRPAERTGFLFCYGLTVIGLVSFSFSGFEPGRALVSAALLIAAQLLRENGGAVYGLCAGVAVTLCDTTQLYLVVAWGFGTLLAGVFASIGKLAAVLAFFLISLLARMLGEPGGGMIPYLWECLAACGLFLLIPRSALDRLRPYLCRRSSEPEGLQAATVFRLRYAGESLRQIGDAVDQVTRRLEVTGDDPGRLIDEAVNEVCAGCERHAACWGERFDERNRQCHELLRLLQKQPQPPLEQYPQDLLESCRNPKVLAAAIWQRYRMQQRQTGAKRRLAAVQSVVAEQFDGLAGLLQELAVRFDRMEQCDETATALLIAWLGKRGIAPTAALVCTDLGGRYRAEICINLQVRRRLAVAELAEYVSRLCEVRMELADLSETAQHQKLLFLQEAVLRLDYGVCQIPKDGNTLCGDSYDYFTAEDGAAYALLSDGMGTGGRAAVDSAMTCSLLGRLLSAGFPFDSAMQLVNAALLVKSSDESLATLDLARVDLFTGRTRLVKCGAAPTFVRRHGKVSAIAASSLPIGILNGVVSEQRAFDLSAGDLLVLVSDGVMYDDAAWLYKMIELWKGPAAELAELIAGQAHDARSDGHGDDVTVCVMILQ